MTTISGLCFVCVALSEQQILEGNPIMKSGQKIQRFVKNTTVRWTEKAVWVKEVVAVFLRLLIRGC